MAVMKDPAQWFGEGVSWVDDTTDVGKENKALVFPALNSKLLNVNVTAAFSRDAVVDHVDSRHVVLVDGSGLGLGKPKFLKNGPEVEDSLTSRDSSDEFSFGATSGCDRLSLAPVGDSTSSETASIAGSGTPVAEIIGMSSVHI